MHADLERLTYMAGIKTDDMPQVMNEELQAQGCIAHIDKHENIIGIKGNPKGAPLLIAHTDTVHGKPAPHIVQAGEYLIGIRDGLQCGPGWDDRAGIAAILQIIPHLENCIVALCAYEEHGCIGARAIALDDMQGACIALELDRRINNIGDPDAVWFTNGTAISSTACKDHLKVLFHEHGYSYREGVYTDIGELKTRGLMPSGFNLSIGYMNEHSDKERLHIPSYEKAIQCARSIIAACIGEYFPHKSEPRTYALDDYTGYAWMQTNQGAWTYTKTEPRKLSRRQRRKLKRAQATRAYYYEDILRDEPPDEQEDYCDICGTPAILYARAGYMLCSECMEMNR